MNKEQMFDAIGSYFSVVCGMKINDYHNIGIFTESTVFDVEDNPFKIWNILNNCDRFKLIGYVINKVSGL